MAMRKLSGQGIGSFFPCRKGILRCWAAKTPPSTVDELKKKLVTPMGSDTQIYICVCMYIGMYVYSHTIL